MIDIKNKNVIVTGATGGIGNSIVKALADQGANVLATGTKFEKLNELKKINNKIKTLQFDISNHDKIEKFIDDATAAASVNLLNLQPDLIQRPRPLSKSERTQHILPRERNLLQVYLDSMGEFADENEMIINHKNDQYDHPLSIW